MSRSRQKHYWQYSIIMGYNYYMMNDLGKSYIWFYLQCIFVLSFLYHFKITWTTSTATAASQNDSHHQWCLSERQPPPLQPQNDNHHQYCLSEWQPPSPPPPVLPLRTTDTTSTASRNHNVWWNSDSQVKESVSKLGTPSPKIRMDSEQERSNHGSEGQNVEAGEGMHASTLTSMTYYVFYAALREAP